MKPMKPIKPIKPVNFINNKLFIMIAIFIVILLIAVMCYSMNNTELFTSVKELHYYSLSTCPHCTDFDPVWQQFQKKTDKCHKYVVDQDDIGRENSTKYNINSFPTVIIIDNGEAIEEVNDLSCTGMREMCEKHKIPCTVSC